MIHIYASEIGYCSVCAPKEMKRQEVENEVNLESPTGIHSSWKIADEKFKVGKSPKIHQDILE